MQPTDTTPNSNDNGVPTLPPAQPMQPMPADFAPPPAPDGSGDSSQLHADQAPVPGAHIHPTEPPTHPAGVPLEPIGVADQPLPAGAVMPGLDRPLTYGERAVGLTFNPSGREDVINVKKLYAALIDKHHTMRTESNDPETKRLHALAITNLQTAQMWSVKALTWEA